MAPDPDFPRVLMAGRHTAASVCAVPGGGGIVSAWKRHFLARAGVLTLLKSQNNEA